MTIKIAPSVLAADFNHLMDEVNLVDKAGCDYIHCDIMDGHFVPNISFGPDIVKKIRLTTNKILDVHLMINPVLPYIKKFVEAGADIISFHIEADNNPLKIIEEIKNQNLKVGIAIKPNTIPIILNIIRNLHPYTRSNCNLSIYLNSLLIFFRKQNHFSTILSSK